jgi:hypothetical protein
VARHVTGIAKAQAKSLEIKSHGIRDTSSTCRLADMQIDCMNM